MVELTLCMAGVSEVGSGAILDFRLMIKDPKTGLGWGLDVVVLV